LNKFFAEEATPSGGSTSSSPSKDSDDNIIGLPWWAWLLIGIVLLLFIGAGIGFFFWRQKMAGAEDDFYDVQNESKLIEDGHGDTNQDSGKLNK